MKKIKNTKGITLVALIITIIVLLILAMVSIRLVMNGGIIGRADNSVKTYSDEEIAEQWKLALAEFEMSRFTGNDINIQERLEKIYGKGNVSDVTVGNGMITATIRKNGETITYRYTSTTGKVAKYIPPISEEQSFVGYYADVDGNGSVDGVIFADLAFNASGQWCNSDGAYSYTKKSSLKKYNKSNEKVQNEKFGEKEIITPEQGTTGNDRFYVMSLNNFTTSSYTIFYWYKEASGKMSPSITSADFGKGNENTGKMITKWNAAKTSNGYDAEKNDQDIWKHIQTIYNDGKGWFIPSRAEWAAFANYTAGLGRSTVNYGGTYKLTNYYWSSSQSGNYHTWIANFAYDYIDSTTVDYARAVRLATTF